MRHGETVQERKSQPTDLHPPLYLSVEPVIRGLLKKLKSSWLESFECIAEKELYLAMVLDYEALEVLERFQKMQVLKREARQSRKANNNRKNSTLLIYLSQLYIILS